ncbi:MAG: HvfA family oxazolone/thioamide-modified RiPP metallophore [Thiobacillus sp.]
MSNKKTLISVAVGTAFAASMGAAPLAFAAENPFALQSLDKGYMVAEHHEGKAKAMKEGKCGEGKCGNMKMGEGKCGMAMADTNKDGKISQEEAAKQQANMFAMMDTNKDGFIDKDEMAKGMKGMEGMKGMKGAEGKCGAMKK